MSENDYPDDWNSRRKEVYKRDRYTCQNCGREGGPHGDAELHAHHVVPKASGGSDDLSNLQTLCKRCHRAVHTNTSAPTEVAREAAHGFLRGMKADVAAIIVYVVMASFYVYILAWLGLRGPWPFLGLIPAFWPASHTRRYILGETDE
jgi:hypothetical protein